LICARSRIADFANVFGAGEWTRTTDLLITNQLLYQLSYAGNKAGPAARRARIRYSTTAMVVTHRREIATRGQGDTHDITEIVSVAVTQSQYAGGIVTVFVVGSTAGVTTIEYEPGAVADLNRMFEDVAPRDADYRHHLRWGDDNGSSHVRAALLGPSLTVPFSDRALLLGTWQQIMLVEFDTRPRRRELVIQIVGE
jgi:secondary thiamine-phosphate synthase enzyme